MDEDHPYALTSEKGGPQGEYEFKKSKTGKRDNIVRFESDLRKRTEGSWVS